MAIYTQNLGLKEPSLYDLVKLEDFNGNSDILDAKIGAVPEGKNLVDMVTGLIDDEFIKEHIEEWKRQAKACSK